MRVLDSLAAPAQLRTLRPEELTDLAAEIREFLVANVSRAGGHLGSNLGVVELTLALHRVFDSPATPILFDTGHQAYVHKLLTGRAGGFAALRAEGGLSGYPARAESPHDFIENSHASTALSYADGLARAFELAGRRGPVVAVVGDGALTGGLAYEALNNLGASTRHVVVVLNDNGRSYAPSVGGLPRHLDRVADRAGYATLVARLAGEPAAAVHDDPAGVIAGLGLDYLGPVDGHDLAALEAALTQAAARCRPVVVHCRTQKGRGYLPAETDEEDRLHSVGSIDVRTGRPASTPAPTWTDAFSQALLTVAERRPDLVALSAAMVGPTGLGPLQQRYPDRCADTGIAEQHMVASAAGLAMGGAHPVVAVYATFAGRAFDQILLDVGLHRLPVTFVLDRAGITGPDGPSHHGMWDLAMLGNVPGMRVAAPRDAQSLVEQLDEAVAHGTGPTALRFPKAAIGPAVPALERWCGLDVLRADDDAQVLLVAVGVLAAAALAAADELAASGVRTTVVDPRWVLPVNPALAAVAAGHQLVVTVEDGVRAGGVGSRLAQLLADRVCPAPVRNLGLPGEYVPHGARAALLARFGLDGPGIAATTRAALELLAPVDPAPLAAPPVTVTGSNGTPRDLALAPGRGRA